jgi:hypothetical protein
MEPTPVAIAGKSLLLGKLVDLVPEALTHGVQACIQVRIFLLKRRRTAVPAAVTIGLPLNVPAISIAPVPYHIPSAASPA